MSGLLDMLIRCGCSGAIQAGQACRRLVQKGGDVTQEQMRRAENGRAVTQEQMDGLVSKSSLQGSTGDTYL